MPNPENWQIKLDGKFSLALSLLTVLLFICFEYILLSRLTADRYLRSGRNYLEEARSLPKSQLVEKSISYTKTLKSFESSIRMNPICSRPHFDYGEVLSQITKVPELRRTIDLKSPEVSKSGTDNFLNLAKDKYIQAIVREPTDAIYHERMGDIYNLLGDSEKAGREFKNAVMLDPQNINIRIYLAQFFFFKGKQSDFIYQIKKAIDFGGQKEVLQFLKSIGREDLMTELQ